MSLALLASSCGGSGDSDQVVPESGDGDNTAIVATRETTNVVVIGADGDAIDAMDAALVEYAIAPALEEVLILDAPSCEQTNSEVIACGSNPEPAPPAVGRRVLVVLDGDLSAVSETLDVIGGPMTVIVSGEPEGSSDALAGIGSVVTFVPGGLSELVSDPGAAFLVGVDDALAAFEPIVIGDGAAASRVIKFFDSRLRETRRVSTAAGPERAAVPQPNVRWVLDLPDPLVLPGSHERAVVVDDIVVFLGGDGVVRGVDAEDGTVLWSKETDADPLSGSASFVSASGNTLLVGTTVPGVNPDPEFEIPPDVPDKSLRALDIFTGDLIWEVTVSAGGSTGHPATDGERVFLWIAEDGVDISFRALDLADGRELWRADGEGAMGLGPPRVDNGEVWVGSTDGILRGFDTQTGAELTLFDQISLGVGGVASRPAVTADRVLFGNDNGTFYAIDRASGDLVWSFETGSPNLPSSPVIADDIVVFGAFDGGVYGLDIDNGDLRWRYDSGTDRFLSSAALADDIVYIASFTDSSSLLALDTRTGEAIWELPIGARVGASPFVDGDTLYLQTPGQLWAVTR